LNVHTESVFIATDAVGQGFQHQWRIYNALTNEWVSPMMLKSDAEKISSDLNSQFRQAMIAEGIIEQSPSVPEGYTLPSTPLTENLHNTSNIDKYAAYLTKNAAQLPTQDDARFQSANPIGFQSTDPSVTAMADFRATARLRAEAANKFVGNTDVTEDNAVRTKQQRGNPRPNQSLEMLVSDNSSDRDFLAGINKAGLLRG
jgi:hypothetical protein